MLYEVSADKRNPCDWRVEATDTDGEYDPGTCFVTIFTGSLAEERAREYAAFKTDQGKTSLTRLFRLVECESIPLPFDPDDYPFA